MVLSHDTLGCSCIFVALPPPSPDAVPACWCVSTPVMRALCVYSTSRLSNIFVLLFCMCVTRAIHSLFAVAVLLSLLLFCAERLCARAWYRCVSPCDVRDRRSVTALWSGMTASVC